MSFVDAKLAPTNATERTLIAMAHTDVNLDSMAYDRNADFMYLIDFMQKMLEEVVDTPQTLWAQEMNRLRLDSYFSLTFSQQL